jgi:hypothetical protein
MILLLVCEIHCIFFHHVSIVLTFGIIRFDAAVSHVSIFLHRWIDHNEGRKRHVGTGVEK